MSDTENNLCNRFEQYGILQLERGQPLDEHYQSCAKCAEAMRAYQALSELIASDSDSEPVAGWQDTVLREIRQQESHPQELSEIKSLRPWFAAIAAGVAAVSVISVFIYNSALMRSPAGHFQASNLELEIISSDNSYRGSDAKIGDNLSILSTVDQPRNALLRVYRDGLEHFACGQKSDCKFDGNELAQLVKLDAYGEYQAIIFLNKTQVGDASSGMDADVLNATDSGNEVIISESVIVR